jgi:hypothetical protein
MDRDARMFVYMVLLVILVFGGTALCLLGQR